LDIKEDEWNASTRYMAEALDRYKVPRKGEVLALVEKMKQDIVEQQA
jgi:hypothetical protein